ncbi:hypothetical protein EXIGLDRAFT_602303 [Exidia glandulosa HHB12029]|uniref:W2 domain-containing protein n=1 Tax=Exidia glandulosa HHB12029 TaxID=1314781 RepID=A0A165PG49_EXIGL|nr:hypothetical protein EXIGLDRAFT_602303 [Exidia glandulosa HHB12029]
MAPAAGTVNIRRDVDDKFYRYRMPILLTKIEGKGNGIKTVIPNMSDVAKALTRPATYPTKFFGCELGAQTSFDEKNDRYIVNGAHDATRLRELLDSFIDKFVLCASCKNPETELIIAKSDDIIRDCKACGQRTKVDMRHKLTTFILKNPPKKNGSDDGEDGDDAFTKRFNEDAAALPDASNADTTFETDTSPEAVRARMAALEAGLRNTVLLGDDDDEDGEDANSPYGILGRWLEENRGETNAVEVYKKIQELGIEKKHKTVQIVVQSLFTEDIVTEFEEFAPVFKKLVTGEKHQKSLLGGTERLVGLEHPSLIPAIPKILMAFYQADILDEEVVKQWGTHVSKKYVDRDTSKKVRKASDPFLKWLDEADDDDDEDDDE